MESNHQTIWENCLKIIKEQVNAQSFKTWFEPIKPMRLQGDVLVIQVPNKFFYEWLEEHYLGVIKKAIRSELGQKAKLEYLIPRRVTRPTRSTTAIPPTYRNKKMPVASKDLERNYGQITQRDSRKIKNPFVIPGIQKIKIDPQINTEYNFDTFVEGECNRLARSAGWAIAKRPGQTSFNPLMIFGSVGLGKTHLAHAVGNEVLKNHEDKTVLYVSSERFTNQFIEALKNNVISDFVNFYQLVDLLIVDDIQFLENKHKTQDIFFHIFNHLHQNGKQIILTSDRPPKELDGIEDRLISRFKWGLSADLHMPSLETRMAIIQQKMQNDGVEIPFNVVEYISHNARTNVREIEGILISLIAQSALNQREIDVELAKQVIGNFVNEQPLRENGGEVGIESIQRVVSEHYNLTIEQLIGKSRKRYIAVARHLAIYLSRQLSSQSLKKIGYAFGKRDHTTVLNSCSTIDTMLKKNEAFADLVEELKRKINNGSF